MAQNIDDTGKRNLCFVRRRDSAFFEKMNKSLGNHIVPIMTDGDYIVYLNLSFFINKESFNYNPNLFEKKEESFTKKILLIPSHSFIRKIEIEIKGEGIRNSGFSEEASDKFKNISIITYYTFKNLLD